MTQESVFSHGTVVEVPQRLEPMDSQSQVVAGRVCVSTSGNGGAQGSATQNEEGPQSMNLALDSQSEGPTARVCASLPGNGLTQESTARYKPDMSSCDTRLPGSSQFLQRVAHSRHGDGSGFVLTAGGTLAEPGTVERRFV